jgi:predicted TIM-barrel fold metal-dependent hydrolase
MIVDAHHHIWRVDRTPWLQGEISPRIFGDYRAIKRDYNIGEFAEDARSAGVEKSVYIQINVAPGDEVWEAEWAVNEGSKRQLIQAVTAFADLNAPNVADVLDRQLEVAPVRSIRQQLHWHRRPEFRFASDPDIVAADAWRRGLSEVRRRGLHFELQVFPAQYGAALDLVDSYPDMTFILLHAGMLADRSEEETQRWSRGLAAFAQRPNVVAKISGLGTFTRSCSVDDWTPVIRRTVDTFGPHRCLFGSNFPIEKIWTDYRTLVATVRSGLSVYSGPEADLVLRGTAERIYGI